MKTRSIFEKLISSSDSEKSCGTREFVAENLESRILYSGAPLAAPSADVVQEASHSAIDFESIDSFMTAAQAETDSNQGPPDNVLTLTSYSENGIESPATYYSAAVSSQKWQSMPIVNDAASVDTTKILDFEIAEVNSAQVTLDPAYQVKIDANHLSDGVFIDFESISDNQCDRLTAICTPDGEAVYESDFRSHTVTVFGIDEILTSMSDWQTIAA